MYTLYGSPSTAGTAIHWMLLELNVPFDLTLLDFDKAEHKTPEYLALNPDGVVPTLIVDGAPTTQMAGIATLLAERHPEAGFAPPVGSAERAEYLSWTFWLANSFQPNFRAWFYPHEPAGGEAQEAVKDAPRSPDDGLRLIELTRRSGTLARTEKDSWRELFDSFDSVTVPEMSAMH